VARTVLALLLFPIFPSAQDQKPPEPPSPLGGEHNSRDPRKCRVCSVALGKALSYLSAKGGSCGFTERLMMGWLGLVDKSGSCSGYAGRAISAAGGARSAGFNGNWAIGLAGIFLAGAQYKLGQGGAMGQIAADAEKHQHHTGGWHHNKNFNMKGYSEDLGILTCMLYGMFMVMKSRGMGVSATMIEKAERNLESIMGSTGVGYGTGKGDYDTAGSRGAYLFMGLHMAGMTDHKYYAKMLSAIQGQIGSLDKGHAVGCLHFLSVSVACHLAGPDVYDRLAAAWIDKLIAKQEADGAILLGDDGVGGGEGKTLGNKVGSTAVFALMLMLQEPGVFAPPKRPESKNKPQAPGSGSPFSQKPKPSEGNTKTEGSSK
jgi:hypothetical protein